MSDKVKNPAAVELGRIGGLIGGKARAAALSPEKRSKIARKAAKARWKKRKESEQNQKINSTKNPKDENELLQKLNITYT